MLHLVFTLQLKFEDDLRISQMFSGDGEMVPFHEELYPMGNVEDWLLQVERVMRGSLKKIIGDSLENYVQVCVCVCVCVCALVRILPLPLYLTVTS